MDGQFVPNLTFGPSTIKCLRKDLGKEPFFDVHMMVARPEQWIEPMADSGCSQYTYHVEATNDHSNVIRRIREAGMKVGLALKPATAIDVVLPFIKQADMVLIMTVEPGFGGQKFMSSMMAKVEALRKAYSELGKYSTLCPEIGILVRRRILGIPRPKYGRNTHTTATTFLV